MAMNGIDETATGLSLAKQFLMECQEGDVNNITLPKPTLRIILLAFTDHWKSDQDRKRSEFKKVAT